MAISAAFEDVSLSHPKVFKQVISTSITFCTMKVGVWGGLISLGLITATMPFSSQPNLIFGQTLPRLFVFRDLVFLGNTLLKALGFDGEAF